MHRSLFFASAITLATAALANDTTATTGAGGLVVEQTKDIDMLSEDLFVSTDQIRIKYVFKNQSASNIDTIVAFPLPPRDLSEEYGGDVAYPSGFQTVVDGKPVNSTLERKAVFKGRDITAQLDKLHIPIAPDRIDDATKVMDKLPAVEKRKLVASGIAGDEEYSDSTEPMQHHLIPLWTVQDRWWFNQRFPAGKAINIEHRYVPGAGGSVDSEVAFKQFRHTEDTKQAIAYYCMDNDFIAAVDRRSSKNAETGPEMPDRRIDYILTTGANWRSPIGSFRLVVDKGKEGNLVSFCEDGVKKISPTQYEVRHTDWRPTRDLHVLIIEPRQ